MATANDANPIPDAASKSPWELQLEDLDLAIDPARLGFATTATLQPLDRMLGQDRALRALEFGLTMRQRGYNVFVSGDLGSGKRSLVRQVLEERARRQVVPDDWVYVHNFDEPDAPLAINLAAGEGNHLRSEMDDIIVVLRRELPKALKAKDFEEERRRLAADFGGRSEALFDELAARTQALGFGVQRLPDGMLVFSPAKGDRPLEPAELQQLSAEERGELSRKQHELEEFAAGIMAKQQQLARELRGVVEEIIRTCARRLIDPMFTALKTRFSQPPATRWLDRVRERMLANLDNFKSDDESSETTNVPTMFGEAIVKRDPFLEYRVNVVVDNTRTQGAPVVFESSPTYKNLFGTVEHDVNLFGRVSTDFTRIKAGGLLKANGGYLIFDLADALTEPVVWKQLKRTLRSGTLSTDAGEPFLVFTTTGLKPQPIPVTAKIVVLGTEDLYYWLEYMDDDFLDLFRVRADFGEETDRSPDCEQAYARFVARLTQAEQLPPFDASAVAEFIRYGAREAAHRGKLSTEFGFLADLVREAACWCSTSHAQTVSATHVRQALDERVFRTDRIITKIRELINEGTLRIDLDGHRVGRVNGLVVADLGDLCFSWPNCVSASVGVGQEGLISIEREADLSGSTHDKGILILTGYLRNRYARAHPLSLTGSITFEQSYGAVDGDSASLAELLCLLSAAANLPLRQDIAVTASLNQHGDVQAVGGVNEKIEGFFDVCRIRGLTGNQGVCIPRANVGHLILRRDVIDAVAKGKFHVWAVDHVDQAIELLTGIPAGDLDREGTFHYRVDQRLQEILSILEEEPAPEPVPRFHVPSGEITPPAPPTLPGDRG